MKNRAGCVCTVCLGDLQSDYAQTFLIVVGEGWLDPLQRDQLAVSAEAGALGPRNPRLSCKLDRLVRVSLASNWSKSSAREL